MASAKLTESYFNLKRKKKELIVTVCDLPAKVCAAGGPGRLVCQPGH